MTKAELIAHIAAAPDGAFVFIDPGDGVLRSRIEVEADEGEIILKFSEVEA